MNTRRIVALMLSLILMLAVSAGLADSNIFAPLEEETAPAVSLTAPSYGAMANVAEDKVEKNTEGGTIVTYRNVPASGYNSFGSFLGEHGFFITKEEREEGRIAYAVSDNQVSFVMIYDPAEQTMQLIYPAGTDYEVSLFPGYTRIEFNQEVSIPGLGRFTFHDFTLSGDGKKAIYYTGSDTSDSYLYEPIHSWLSFTFYNTSTEYVNYGYFNRDFKNDLFTATLVYLNADDTYNYTPHSNAYGAYNPSRKWIATSNNYTRNLVFANQACAPLSSMEFAAAFDLTPTLRASADGTIAIKLHFKTGETYLLVARENGTNLGIASPQAN